MENADPVNDIAVHEFDDERVFAPSRRRLTAGLVLTIVIVAFEGLAVSTIMPIAVLDLHGLTLYAWSFSGFMLGSLVGTVASGEYADRSGPAYPFIGALVVFSCGLVACGTATSMLIFIAGRVIEGLGTGAVRSLVWLILRRTYPIRMQARMAAVLSSAWILPSLLGPTMAGVLARAWGWRVVFLALLPLAPLALAMVLAPLKHMEAEPVPAASSARAGATLLLAAGVALFIAGLQANSILWIAVLVIAGAALSWPALYRILPAGTLLFRIGMPAALAMRGLLMFAYCEALAFFPLALEMVRGLSATTAGVALSMGSIGWTSGSWTQAACDYRFGSSSRPRIMLFGLIALAIGIGGAAGTVVTRYPLGVAIVRMGSRGPRDGYLLQHEHSAFDSGRNRPFRRDGILVDAVDRLAGADAGRWVRGRGDDDRGVGVMGHFSRYRRGIRAFRRGLRNRDGAHSATAFRYVAGVRGRIAVSWRLENLNAGVCEACVIALVNLPHSLL